MDYSSSLHRTTRTLPFSPFAVKPKAPHSLLTNNFTGRRSLHRSLVVARAGPSHCEFSSSPLNTPIELNSAAGKFLSSVLQNQRQFFNVAVSDELKQLADDRDAAVNRMFLSIGSDEASLHRYYVFRACVSWFNCNWLCVWRWWNWISVLHLLEWLGVVVRSSSGSAYGGDSW